MKAFSQFKFQNFSKLLLLNFLITNISVTQLFSEGHYSMSFAKESVFLGAGSIIFGSSLLFNDSLKQLSPNEIVNLNRNSVNWFDRSATYNFSKSLSSASDVLVGLTIAAPISLLFSDEIYNDKTTVGLMYIETMLIAGAIPSLVKEPIDRYRPLVYNPDVSFAVQASSDPKRSFFSGHTTVAFASAVFLSTVYSEYYPNSKYNKYVWAGSLLAASTVGFLRYQSGLHYPSDILVGAAVGSLVGYFVPYFHKLSNNNMTISPIPNQNNITFSFNYQF